MRAIRSISTISGFRPKMMRLQPGSQWNDIPLMPSLEPEVADGGSKRGVVADRVQIAEGAIKTRRDVGRFLVRSPSLIISFKSADTESRTPYERLRQRFRHRI